MTQRREKMGKAIMIIVASVITLFFLHAESFAGDMLSVKIHKSNNIIGATVRNIQGKKLGEISNLMFDKDTGNITYVIISHSCAIGHIKIHQRKERPTQYI
jgi:sporulation protein YlmC with PRC-barrel domain